MEHHVNLLNKKANKQEKETLTKEDLLKALFKVTKIVQKPTIGDN